jgi:mannose-6-phosphate isomerase-like protein (cupin superfamily)
LRFSLPSMKRKHIRFGKGFKVVLGNRRVQAAQMTLSPGQSEGGPSNRHRNSDQWLYVAGGRGTAIIKGKPYPLRAGTLMLIEHGDRHEIRNTGRQLLKTLNLYSPPGYTATGDELPAAKPSEG